ncbi:MAG: hypothetical protein ACYDBT_10775 [Desulfobulbaceae bacterium]
MNTKGYTTWLLLLLIVFVQFPLLAGCSGQKEEPLESAAWDFMVQSVSAKLGNPAGLTFPPDAVAAVTDLGNNRFQITSFVDFTNEKGEQQRSYFFAIAVFRDKSWTIERLKFSE